ncbi:MAG: hypothetical protein ACK4S4_01900 [Pyrinomonadaceae bacterium]
MLLPLAVIVLLALYPQMALWLVRGSSWSGAYAASNYDEAAYSAYLNSQVHGRPRKYDPFLARPTEHESLYSVQMVPAEVIAAPAAVFGLSTSTTFILLSAAIAVASALCVFAFLRMATDSDAASAAGTLAVLCMGTAVAFQGELRQLALGSVLIDYLPFMRRYQPGFGFPLFFLFCAAVWRSVSTDDVTRRRMLGIGAGALFAVLVFTYFFLWTAAAAWLACFAMVSLALDRGSFRRIAESIAPVAIFGAATLLPYFWMLADRSPETDTITLLTRTRMPELLSLVMLAGLAAAAAAVIAARYGKVELRSPSIVLVLSLGITPAILLNQQIVTGRSLQPVHYEIFIGNYLVVAALVIFARQSAGGRFDGKIALYVGLIAAGWGLVEAAGSTGRNAEANLIRDASAPAIEYIDARAAERGRPAVVHATNFLTADIIPTFAANARPLWSIHLDTAGSVSPAENKRLFYLYMYYSGFDEKDLERALAENSFEVTAVIFGTGRALPSLGQGAAAVRAAEIRNEVAKYAEFIRSFDARGAAEPVLDHIIVPADAEPDLSRLDRWYERVEGRTFGLFRVYELKPRSAR